MMHPRLLRSRCSSEPTGNSSAIARIACAAWFASILAAGCGSVQTLPPRSAATFEPPPDGYEQIDVTDTPVPDPATGHPVSLDGMLVYAERHAPMLLVARQRLGLGGAALAAASPLLPANPDVSLGVGAGLNEGSNHVDFAGSVSQRFEIAGERRLRLEAARRTQDRLRAEFDEARWEVHRDVHSAFHSTLVARERLAASERVLAFQEELLEIARARLRAGEVSPLPVRVAEGELSQARLAQIAAKQAYLRARLQLGAIAGWPPTQPPEPVGELDQPRDPPETSVLIEVARAHQPRLRTLHAAQLEALAETRAADREAWPEPSLGVELMRENFRLGPPETQLLGVFAVPIPMFQRNQGARAAARAEVNIVSAERNAFGLQLLYLIEQNRAAVAATAAQVRIYSDEILPTFEENLRLIKRAFELGEIDILQVSVARERFLRIQAEVLAAYNDYFQAVADLEASIGTDLWPEEGREHFTTRGGQP